MRLTIVILLAIVLSGCSHYKWAAKHQAELCANCPKSETNTTTETDTTVWSIVPADTAYISGLDFPVADPVIVETDGYKVTATKDSNGKTNIQIIRKETKKYFIVTKYRQRNELKQVTEVIRYKIPVIFWIGGGASLVLAFLFGWFLHKFFS